MQRISRLLGCVLCSATLAAVGCASTTQNAPPAAPTSPDETPVAPNAKTEPEVASTDETPGSLAAKLVAGGSTPPKGFGDGDDAALADPAPMTPDGTSVFVPGNRPAMVNARVIFPDLYPDYPPSGYDVAGVKTMLQSRKAEFEECYVQALERDPTVKLMVRLTLKIFPDGHIDVLGRRLKPLDHKRLAKCVADVMGKMKFPGYSDPDKPSFFADQTVIMRTK